MTLSAHNNDNLNAIAAVVIGGTSLFGGVGHDRRHGGRRLHPDRAAERLHHQRDRPLLAGGPGRRDDHRRRLHRSAPPSTPVNARGGPRALPTIDRRRRAHRQTPHPSTRRRPHEPSPHACRRRSRSPSPARPLVTAASAHQQAPRKTFTIYLIPGIASDAFYTTMHKGAAAEAAEARHQARVPGLADGLQPADADPVPERRDRAQAGRDPDRPDRQDRPDRADQEGHRGGHPGLHGRHVHLVADRDLEHLVRQRRGRQGRRQGARAGDRQARAPSPRSA